MNKFPTVLDLERFQTAKVTFKVTEGHWLWCRSIGHIRFPISRPACKSLELGDKVLRFVAYAKSKAANSDINTVELLKSYCLTHILHAREALPFSKTDILRLDNLTD